MTLKIFILTYLFYGCFSAGQQSQAFAKKLKGWRYFTAVLLWVLGYPATRIITVFRIVSQFIKLFITTQTPLYYMWQKHSGYFEKMTVEQRESIISVTRWKLNFAQENNLQNESGWKYFLPYAQQMVDKYDPEKKIEPSLTGDRQTENSCF